MRSALDSKPGWILTYMLSHLCNGFLRFTSGVTPADLLTASIVSKIFIHFFKHWWDLNSGSNVRHRITFGLHLVGNKHLLLRDLQYEDGSLKAACVEYCRLRITVDTIQVQRSALTAMCNLRSKKIQFKFVLETISGRKI